MNTTRKLIPIIPILLLLALMVTSPAVRAQEDASDFTRTFEVFIQSRDAFRLFDVSPEDVIYSLPASYTIGPGDILQAVSYTHLRAHET